MKLTFPLSVSRSHVVSLGLMVTLNACVGSVQHPTTTTTDTTGRVGSSQELDPVHVVGSSASHPGDAYDASMLFDRANTLVQDQKCAEAIPVYDQLIREFPEWMKVPDVYFNRGVCQHFLSQYDPALESYREAVKRATEFALHRDALFRITMLGDLQNKPDIIVEGTTPLLELDGLSLDERVEALARNASAQLLLNHADEALAAAHRAIELVPTRQDADHMPHRSFIAQARFVVAEEMRLRAEKIVPTVGSPDLREQIKTRMVTLQGAHMLYNESIRMGDANWAAAAGVRIGEMYQGLYNAIVNAPTPPHWTESAIAIYRRGTAEHLRTLLERTVAAWTLTLDMARRTGLSDNPWVLQAETQITTLKDLINASAPAPTTTPRHGRSGGAARP